jgi:hypothetical protein
MNCKAASFLFIAHLPNQHRLRGQLMYKFSIVILIIPVLLLAGCSQQVAVIDYPPLDWAINGKRLTEMGCEGDLQESCPELVALGCDQLKSPRFFLGGLLPPYPVVECIHEGGEPPDQTYFRQVQGLDTRYRSYVVHQEGAFRLLIKQSEFKAIFAPVESSGEAISYAMAMTSLEARFDLDPNANVDYLVDRIEETHAEETAEGYLVYLFDGSHRMGCEIHPFYVVTVVVTPEGDVHEVARQKIYESYACFDFGVLSLDED